MQFNAFPLLGHTCLSLCVVHMFAYICACVCVCVFILLLHLTLKDSVVCKIQIPANWISPCQPCFPHQNISCLFTLYLNPTNPTARNVINSILFYEAFLKNSMLISDLPPILLATFVFDCIESVITICFNVGLRSTLNKNNDSFLRQILNISFNVFNI